MTLAIEKEVPNSHGYPSQLLLPTVDRRMIIADRQGVGERRKRGKKESPFCETWMNRTAVRRGARNKWTVVACCSAVFIVVTMMATAPAATAVVSYGTKTTSMLFVGVKIYANVYYDPIWRLRRQP